MSFALEQTDDEDFQQDDKDKSDSAVSLGGAGGVESGGSGVAGSVQGAQPQTAKPSSSGSWTNLQSYLDANADQGGQVGSQIAGTVSGQAQTAQKDVENASSDFSNSVKASTVNADSDAVNRAINGATSATAGSAGNADDVAAFQKQANASYTGPTDFTKSQTYNQAQQDIDKAQQSLSQTGSEEGRQVLLQGQYANTSQNGYNQGEQNLDQLLLENSQGGRAALEPLQNQWSGLSAALGNATTTGNASAESAKATNAATAKAAQDALAGANSKFQSTLTNQASTQSTAYDQLMKDLSSGSLSADEAAQLGLSDNNEAIYNVDLNKYLSGSAPTLANTATKDQYAQAAALAQLAGQPSSTFLPSSSIDQVGSGKIGFNAAAFQNEVQASQRQYQEQSANIASQLAELRAHYNNSQTGEGTQPQVKAMYDSLFAQQRALDAQYSPARTLSWNGITRAVRR